ncbi:hypothetical protein C0Q70_01734 [Pomacea canaliculata]|uniref:Uncharacterized protein n=1 Tax=Pomacea canaliculata TaxID=400727 RepID=A0A2T7Q0A5_POMCA|nr:hypothetical protein C0Q70_01734 [Pomacea canaliculata]
MNTRVLTGRLRSTGLDAYLINLNDFPSTDRSRQRQARVVGSSLNASRVAGVLPVVYAAPPPTPHKVRVYLRCPPGTCVTIIWQRSSKNNNDKPNQTKRNLPPTRSPTEDIVSHPGHPDPCSKTL